MSNMKCERSYFDSDSLRFKCKMSGDDCIFLIPNWRACPENDDGGINNE